MANGNDSTTVDRINEETARKRRLARLVAFEEAKRIRRVRNIVIFVAITFFVAALAVLAHSPIPAIRMGLFGYLLFGMFVVLEGLYHQGVDKL